MITTNYLTDLVTKYFSTVFFLWVIGNILLRVLVTKKRIKKRKKKKGGGIGNIFYDIWCFLLKLFTLGHYGCGHKVDVEYEYFFRKRWSPSSPMETV
jgi:hypothetical protein